eukprot:GHVL01018734.1.p1 GENE.GHVL01018734.1~~GHVL01018734.1.p1  ORF type:complete len:254 (-),score=50.10 GHVL01018734.1:42-803(-)
MRKPIVGGNWKCNGSVKVVTELANMLAKADFNASQMEVVVSPVALHIPMAYELLKNTPVKVMCQNCSATLEGAYTGEITVNMVKEFGLEWVLIGHSERRQYYGETDKSVAEKVKRAQEADLMAMVCIGEVLSEREADKTLEVITRQVEAFLTSITKWDKVVIAYEPVWAIGTGKVATVEQAQEAHKSIRDLISAKSGEENAKNLRILYGGSVSDSNASGLIGQPDVDGFLVGGASLKPAFMDIIKETKTAKGL